jgi:hypothetical protein
MGPARAPDGTYTTPNSIQARDTFVIMTGTWIVGLEEKIAHWNIDLFQAVAPRLVQGREEDSGSSPSWREPGTFRGSNNLVRASYSYSTTFPRVRIYVFTFGQVV